MLAGLDELVALRSRIDRKAMSLMRSAIRKGFRGQIVDVRLSAIDLVSSRHGTAVTVVVEGEACNMLRPFRDEWHVCSADELADRFEEFCRLGRIWHAKRHAARAAQAVGFIDPLALVAIDALPGGRQPALKEIARTLETGWFADADKESREMTGLTWYDGVVYPVARLSTEVQLSGRDLHLHGTQVNATAVGRRIDEFVDHPALAGRVIDEVAFERPGFAQVRLSPSLLPFTASGEVLAGQRECAGASRRSM